MQMRIGAIFILYPFNQKNSPVETSENHENY